jgi:CheY-like chemotaxis protein
MASAPGERPLILIVEDEILVRTLIADILHDGGFRVIEAKNAAEALRVLEACPDVDVLFTDAEMPPGLTGFDLAREVCERWPSIEILVSSGRMRPGSDDMPACVVFLPKPWTAESRVRHVQEAAERTQDRQTHR